MNTRKISFYLFIFCLAQLQTYNVGADSTKKSIKTKVDDVQKPSKINVQEVDITKHKSDQNVQESPKGNSNKAPNGKVHTNAGKDLTVVEQSSKKTKLENKGNILFFHNAGTRSHVNVMAALAEGLVKHGHKVTTVFYAKTNIVHEGYTEILIEDK